MSDRTTRRELLRPLHLIAIALGCAVFAGVITLMTTGAFTTRVRDLIADGEYSGLTPVALSLVVAGGAFIVTLVISSMLILTVDPKQYDRPSDRPVLYDDAEDSGDKHR